MSLATFPLIAWGTPSDISASPWSDSNTPVVTGGQADPFGGTSAYSIEDDNAAGSEGRILPFVPSSSGVTWVAVFVKQGTATTSFVALYDNTAAAYRHRFTMTWVGGTYTTATIEGAGTFLPPVSLGGGWFLQVWSAEGVVAGNTNQLRLYGAGNTSADTGTTLWYVRNVVLLDYVDGYRRFADKRPGYATVEGASGVRDAWDQGTNYVRRGTVQWVPPTARSTPALVSGFTGANESTGVNCGVQAMLLAGMQMTSMVWVPDRSACSVNQSVYLTQPTAGWEPTQQPNGDFTFPLELVATSAPGAVA